MNSQRLLCMLGGLAATLVVVGCSGSSDPSAAASSESDYTSEGAGGGDGGGDGGDAQPSAAPATVAPYALADSAAGKMRWSLAGASVIEGQQVEIAVAQDARPFWLTGAARIDGALSVVHAQFGRAGAVIAPGVYDCATNDAVVLIKGDDESSQRITVVQGAAQRPCKVFIDAAQDVGPQNTPVIRSSRQVVGRIEAEVGLRADASSPTTSVRAAFAVKVTEMVR